MITFENKDCMQAKKELTDKYFDLAIVDPPYGDVGGENSPHKRTEKRTEATSLDNGQDSDRGSTDTRQGGVSRTGGTWAAKYGKKIIAWDVAPKQEYFDELFRISRNQIIWGGNYFGLPPTRCFVVWRKTNIPSKGFSMSPVEYAWTSFNENASVYDHSSLRDATSGKFHPTEKPIDLYEWLLSKYAKQGDKILDTHVGSASSLIACYNMGFDVWGYEIDTTYYELAQARIKDEQAQIRMDIPVFALGEEFIKRLP